MINIEIERKWLLEQGVPEDLTLMDKYDIYQGYISTKPEVRIRKNVYKDGLKTYMLEFKSDGKLKRTEVQIPIREQEFKQLLEVANIKEKELIHKKYRAYKYSDKVIEVSSVDEGTENHFIYAEIEFPTATAARGFKAPDWLGKEVTNEINYKMKNYWVRTRGKNKEIL